MSCAGLPTANDIFLLGWSVGPVGAQARRPGSGGREQQRRRPLRASVSLFTVKPVKFFFFTVIRLNSEYSAEDNSEPVVLSFISTKAIPFALHSLFVLLLPGCVACEIPS